MQIINLSEQSPGKLEQMAPWMQATRFDWANAYQHKGLNATSMPSITLAPHVGAPNFTEKTVPVSIHKHLCTSNPNADIPTKHIHEHHHYDLPLYKHNVVEINERNQVAHVGYLLVASKPDVRPAAPVTPPNLHQPAMFLRSNRSFENPNSYQQYGYANCPFYGNPNAYPQNQRLPYPNGQQYHYHQHYYHAQYYAQHQVNQQHHHHLQVLPQQPRFFANHHTHLHNRPFPVDPMNCLTPPQRLDLLRMY